MPSTPIQSPAAYVPRYAATFADTDGTSIQVSAATPMPVALAATAVSPTLLAASTSTSGVFGTYQPAIDRAIMLALSGTWTGLVKVLRSTDGGTTKLPLTIAGSSWAQYTSNICETIWEEAEASARIYLDVALATGTLTYRMGQ